MFLAMVSVNELKALGKRFIAWFAARRVYLFVAALCYALGVWIFFKQLPTGGASGPWLLYEMDGIRQYDLLMVDGAAIWGMQNFYRGFATTTEMYDFAVRSIFVANTIVYCVATLKLASHEQAPRPFVFGMFALFLSFILFFPGNVMGGPAVAYYAMSLACCAAFAAVFRTKAAERCWLTLIPQAVVGFFAFFYFGSILSIALALYCIASFLFRQEWKSGWIRPVGLILVVLLISGHFIVLTHSMNASGGFATFWNEDATTRFFRSFVPVAFGAKHKMFFESLPENVDLTESHAQFISVLGIILFVGLLLAPIYVALRKRPYWLESVFMTLVAIGFATYYSQTPLVGNYRHFDGVRNIGAVLALFALMAALFGEHQKEKAPLRNIKNAVASLLLASGITVSSLFGFYSMYYIGQASVSDTTDVLTVARKSDIKTDEWGLSALGLDLEESYRYVNYVRENRLGPFEGKEVTSDIFTTDIYFDTNGEKFPSTNTLWMGSRFRAVLNTGDTGQFNFAWYLRDDQKGGTMSIYFDDELRIQKTCTENYNSVWKYSFPRNKDIFIQCEYSKPHVSLSDRRDLAFVLVYLNFGR